MGTKALLVYESELSFVKYSNLRLLFNMLSILLDRGETGLSSGGICSRSQFLAGWGETPVS